jgi:hypothetical protein
LASGPEKWAPRVSGLWRHGDIIGALVEALP